MSEAEAARDFWGLLAQVRTGDSVVIDDGEDAIAVVAPPQRRSNAISETIERLKAFELKHGHPLVVDKDFADDLEDIIAQRRPRDTSAWD